MRRTLDYRSALVMAAALSGSALAQAATVRAQPEPRRPDAGDSYRRSVVESYQRPATPAWFTDLREGSLA